LIPPQPLSDLVPETEIVADALVLALAQEMTTKEDEKIAVAEAKKETIKNEVVRVTVQEIVLAANPAQRKTLEKEVPALKETKIMALIKMKTNNKAGNQNKINK
jgi:hypothetical protein